MADGIKRRNAIVWAARHGKRGAKVTMDEIVELDVKHGRQRSQEINEAAPVGPAEWSEYLEKK